MTVHLSFNDRTKQRFEKSGNSPISWFMSADHLLAAARVLRREYRSFNMDLSDNTEIPPEEKLLPSIFLLYGFALENLLKALFLKNGGVLVKDGRYCGKNNHRLHTLAEKSAFSVSSTEKTVLQGLSKKLVSSARYPIGTCYEQHKIESLPDRSRSDQLGFNTGDIQVIEGIAKRLITELDIPSY